jgi:nanoRNase/pAp phosphatase (c-di-AMP/oligoRNAs hydrolase)
MVYALWPDQNTSIWIVNGFRNQNTVFACGHSIINRSSQTNIGKLMSEYGGGGHEAAGTCQVDHADAPSVLKELVAQMRADDTANAATRNGWHMLKAA